MCKRNLVSSVVMVMWMLTGCGVAPEEMGDLPLEGEASVADVQEQPSLDVVEEFSPSPSSPPPGTTSIRQFSCFVSNGDRCSSYAWCPNGPILGVQVACNLEVGYVSDGLTASLPMNRMYVERPSDVVSDGRCSIGNYTISQGMLNVSALVGREYVSFGCSERDANSRGDCHIQGLLYCGG